MLFKIPLHSIVIAVHIHLIRAITMYHYIVLITITIVYPWEIEMVH